MSDEFDLIIHTACGMPVEFCECHKPPVSYDWENDTFKDNSEGCPPHSKLDGENP